MEITVRDCTTCYYNAGKSALAGQRNIVFIHGATHDHSAWALQSRYFAYHGYNVFAVDLPAHGRSQGEPITTIEAFADWLQDFLSAAGIDRAILAGHSMGSLIALETAARMPSRIEKIALVGCAFPMSVSEQLLDAAQTQPEQTLRTMSMWSFAPGAHLAQSAAPGFYLPGTNLAMKRHSPRAVLPFDLRCCNDYRNGLAAAAAVQCPGLLLCGERDRMTPLRAVQALAQALPDSRVIRVPQAGHALMSEQPMAVLTALKAFFADDD